MEGIVYLGQRSINVSTWSDRNLIDDALKAIRNLIETINKSGYAKVKIPNDWGAVKLTTKNFWDTIEEICQGQSDIIGYIYKELFDHVFNQCIDTNLNYEGIENHLINNNPDGARSEYYGAFRLGEFWPDVPEKVHISDKQDLNNWAHNFLAEAPNSEINYTKRCEVVFSNLVFHSNFSETLKGHGTISRKSKYGKAPETGVIGFSSSITKALSVLNNVDIQDKNTKDILSEIQSTSGFDCTEQGGEKAHLKFSYEFEAGKTQFIPCEYHIKINVNNRNDGVHYQDRIYFGFFDHGKVKKIFVAHSGKHL